MKTFYLFNETNGFYEGVYEAQESPLELGTYISPVNATDSPPPSVELNQKAQFINGQWSVYNIPANDPADEPLPLTYKELRAKEYPSIIDYIDGVVKGDQAQIDKYIADCLALKAKYPKGVA